jgi:hypothetical protein
MRAHGSFEEKPARLEFSNNVTQPMSRNAALPNQIRLVGMLHEGGENTLWHGTPLIALYNKHVAGGKYHVAANEAAGQDLGWLVKAMLSEDKRTYEVRNDGYVNSYRWIGNEP